MRNKKICVVGGGVWGKNHIRTLHKLGCLGGIVDSNPNTLIDLKKQYPDIPTFSSLSSSFDSVFSGYVVATTANTHYEVAKSIINKKISVLIEKPMTLNVSEAEKLLKYAKDNKVGILIGHVMLFHPAIQKIKDLIDCGKIGKVQYIYSNRLNLGQVRKEENVFWSFAPHDISILQYLTNSFPIKINTMGGAFLQNNIFDSTITFLEYPANIKAHIYLSWLHPFKEHRIVVIGSNGMISFEDSAQNKPLKFYDKKFIVDKDNFKKIDGETEQIDYSHLPPLENELSYFIDNLDYGFSISNGKTGLEVVKILSSASEKIKDIH